MIIWPCLDHLQDDFLLFKRCFWRFPKLIFSSILSQCAVYCRRIMGFQSYWEFNEFLEWARESCSGTILHIYDYVCIINELTMCPQLWWWIGYFLLMNNASSKKTKTGCSRIHTLLTLIQLSTSKLKIAVKFLPCKSHSDLEESLKKKCRDIDMFHAPPSSNSWWRFQLAGWARPTLFWRRRLLFRTL